MKFIFFISLLFIQTSVLCQSPSNPSIEIKYVGPGINTIIAVDYKKFDSAFNKSMYRNAVIADSLLFNNLVNGYKIATYQKKYRRIDTRYKITLHLTNTKKPVLIYTDYYGDAVINGKLLSDCDLSQTLHNFIANFQAGNSNLLGDK